MNIAAIGKGFVFSIRLAALVWLGCNLLLAIPVAAAGKRCALPTSTAYKSAGDAAVYYVTPACTKQVFSGPSVFLGKMKSWSKIRLVTKATLAKLPKDKDYLIVAPSAMSPSTASVSASTPPKLMAGESRSCYRVGDASVVLIVDPRLQVGIKDGLNQFERDLCQTYGVIEATASFTTPPDLRNYLQAVSVRERLAGAIIFGDFPHAYQFVTGGAAKVDANEVLSLQYFTNFKGTYTASSAYRSPGQHAFSYDEHAGDHHWDIWLGVLPLYRGDVQQSVAAINRYFAKNHAYRQSGSTIKRAFALISPSGEAVTDTSEFSVNRSNISILWSPLSTAASSRIYFNNTIDGNTTDRGLQEVSGGSADFTVFAGHGGWRLNSFFDIDWVESHPLRTIFYWDTGCAVGDLDHPSNLLTSVLYSETSSVLFAYGTTAESVGLGSYNAMAKDLAEKKSFGDAFLDQINNHPLIETYKEMILSTPIMLGDPTLRLR